MNRRQKIIVSVTGIFLVLLLLVGLTYAYFLTKVTGNTNDKSISVTTANLVLVYDDGNGILEAAEALIPGSEVKFKTANGDIVDSKTFTVTNEGNKTADYVVVIENTSVTYAKDGVTTDSEGNEIEYSAGDETEFDSNDFVYTLTCTSGCNGVDIPTTFPINGGILINNSIDVDEVQTYELSMTYKETGVDQSGDMNKTLTARVNIKDISTVNPYDYNVDTLAYNIINNAVMGNTGTTLVTTPETTVAEEISKTSGTGEYANIPVTNASYDWLYADTEEGAASGTAVNACTDDLIGKWLYDNSSYFYSGVKTIQVTGCDGNVPMYYGEVLESEAVLSVTQDDYGTSYYYRGAVEDNYVEFNNMCWRIVRIEGDGSVKMILAAQKKCSEINAGDIGSAFIGTGRYGYNKITVTNSSSETSVERNVGDYVNSPYYNTTSIKYKLDAWLTSNLIDTTKLKKDSWCLGNKTDVYDTAGVLLSNSVNDLMYNNTQFYYDAYKRLGGIGATPSATLRCNGNKYETHESYIGTLTVDEVVFAGGKFGSYAYNYNFYLLNNSVEKSWLTLSLSRFNEGYDYVCTVTNSGTPIRGEKVSSAGSGIRPVITLAVGTLITDGNGTKNNPYIVG